MSYDIRSYRSSRQGKDLTSFQVVIKETDLLVRVDKNSFQKSLIKLVEDAAWQYRRQLENFIAGDPGFKQSLTPYLVSPGAPWIAVLMAQAANQAGVGPMAAVAGVFAELVGNEILKYSQEVIVENGGDIFLKVNKTRKVSIFCGKESPFHGRLALEIKPKETPLGVCTSSGIIGPSYSMGRADAAVVVSSSTPLADAAATALANLVKEKDDVDKALQKAKEITGIKGVLVVKDDRIGAWGKIKIVSP